MATRSFIGKLLPDGTIRAIYCHSDGYPEWNGAMLVHYYSTHERIDALLDLGDISCLETSIEKPAGHTFGDSIEGYTVASSRDRGEKGQDNKSVNFHSDTSFRRSANNCDAQYAYLWKDGEWWVCAPETSKGYAMVDKSMPAPRAMPRPITDVPSTASEAW